MLQPFAENWFGVDSAVLGDGGFAALNAVGSSRGFLEFLPGGGGVNRWTACQVTGSLPTDRQPPKARQLGQRAVSQ